MKYILALIMIVISIKNAHAMGENIAYVPKGCNPISAEYSTGGGDKVIQYLEVMCEFENGDKILYIDRILSVGGVFGVGRFTQPDKIIFREHNKDELEVK